MGHDELFSVAMWIDDQVLALYRQDLSVDFFIPTATSVVLGASNNPKLEVFEDYCRENKIPILKRYGGGGAVVLYPGCVVLRVGTWVKEPYKNAYYFRLISNALVKTFAVGDSKLATARQSGISDIVFNDKKFVGSSLFRSRNYLLFQASILCELDLSLMARSLRHPTREPEYRRNRSHEEFLMGLSQINSNLNSQGVLDLFNQWFLVNLLQEMKDEFIDPVEGQFEALERRLARS